jgi:type IV fimbrial biogenesis protein FimT
MKRRQIRGFTLIEVIVVMVIVAVAVLAVAPQITSWLRDTQVRNTADSLVNAVNRARNEAVRRNEEVSLWLVSTDDANPGAMSADCALSNTSAAWVVSLSDPSGECADSPSDTAEPMIVETHSRADGTQGAVVAALNAANTAATSITFNGYGRVTNTAAAIQRINISHQSGDTNLRSLRITITGAGSVRMCDPSVTDTSDPRKC